MNDMTKPTFQDGATPNLDELTNPFSTLFAIANSGSLVGFPASKDECATAMISSLPVAFLNLVADGSFKGGPLLDLSESKGIKTATAKEISNNYSFICPVVKLYPCKAGCGEPMETHGFFKQLLSLIR